MVLYPADSESALSAADALNRLEVELALSEVRCRGGSLGELIVALTDLLGCQGYLLGAEGRIVAKAVPDGASAGPVPRGVIQILAEGPEPQVLSHDGLDYVVAVVATDQTKFGHLVLRLSPDTSLALALWAASRASRHLEGEVLAQRRIARVAWNARANLGRQMIRGSSYDSDLRACAEYLGVDLDADRVIVFVLERGRSSASTVDSGRLAESMKTALGVDVLPVRGTEGVLLAVEVPSETDRALMLRRIKDATVDGLEAMGDQDAVAGYSAVTPPGLLRRAYREAREVARCVDRYAGPGTRVLGSDELGPARLLVANSDGHAVRTFVFDVLGGLMDGASSNIMLLATLQTWFEHGRNIRECAARLEVHENTVRHRLAKIAEITALDVVGSSNDQLSLHTALLVLRLQGHHAVPAF